MTQRAPDPSGIDAPQPDSIAEPAPPGAVSDGGPPGWIALRGPGDQGRRTPLLLGCLLLGALLLASPLLAVAILDNAGSSGSDTQTIGFGSGGSGCTLTNLASSFPLDVPIRDVVTFSPPLPAGATVTIRIEKNGTELVDRRETVTAGEAAACIQGTLSPLEVGHYRVEAEVSPSTMPLINGEFDVTP